MITLNRNSSFRRAYTRGKYFASPAVVTYIVKNRCRNNRIGITTSKKVGNAVKRNRSRRVIKEAYRLIQNKIVKGYDIVFVARGKTSSVKMDAVQKDMINHLKKAGIFYEEPFNFKGRFNRNSKKNINSIV